ncbi:hypothetical protein FMUND_14339 [Fusarium mundagurra]|uniref:Uncharacterized protein n=1 Tax=Fusarium mundagurra TaxID=1567541 RepID=A0A8H5XW21_9HYPO|nr:hypothetical protein FMUND_14339 [Fusarium mundagurra]
MDQTNAAKSPASAKEDTIDTERRAPPTSQESSSPKLSLPPGIEISLGLVPRRVKILNGPLGTVNAERDELAVEVKKLKAEKAQVEREKQIVEAKNELLEAEVRHKDAIIGCLRGMLERHHLL